jgi:hypothetical protein
MRTLAGSSGTKSSFVRVSVLYSLSFGVSAMKNPVERRALPSAGRMILV